MWPLMQRRGRIKRQVRWDKSYFPQPLYGHFSAILRPEALNDRISAKIQADAVTGFTIRLNPVGVERGTPFRHKTYMFAQIENHLLIFTRYPEPGTTKTRLIPALGKKGAADLQRTMTEGITAEARKLAAIYPVEMHIHYEGGNSDRMATWLGRDASYRPQTDGDIGCRMTHAFKGAFDNGARNTIIAGSDIPDLSAAILHQAFDALNRNDLVLGPARDGGYYLMGLRRNAFDQAVPKVFENMDWGTETVLADTLAAAERLNLKVALLKELTDIDRPEDVEKLNPDKSPDPNSISVIIPALNEASRIVRTIQSAAKGEGIEIIVVDGGSHDHTPDLAAAEGATVLHTAPSKARQMNMGAAAAKGAISVFLHADTLLPPSYDVAIRHILSNSGVAGGAFSLKIDSCKAAVRLIERSANLRSRLLGLPYGDQALFVRNDLFFKIGGFEDIPIMEDYAFIRTLGKHGRITVSRQSVLTSGRRWESVGVLRTFFTNQVIILAYHFGTSVRKLAHWYRRGPYTS
jgi:uncharacterized protein